MVLQSMQSADNVTVKVHKIWGRPSSAGLIQKLRICNGGGAVLKVADFSSLGLILT